MSSKKQKRSYPPPFEENGKPLFTGVKPEKVARYVILTVQDPLGGFKGNAAEEIVSYFDSSEKIGDTRMFRTYTGEYKGMAITVCVTGSGAPETELALIDFMKFTEADTFIRLGTSGALQREIDIGDIVISSAAIRDEGTSKEYIDNTYPAVASLEIVLALASAAEELGVRYHIGITRSNDAIYVGEGRPIKGYIQSNHEDIPKYWEKANVLNVEREASLILTLCNIFKTRGGALCTIVDNELTGRARIGVGKEESIKIAIEGIKKLSTWDKIKDEQDKEYLTEDIIKRK